VHFEWDPDKEDVNLRQHGVNFSEAVETFRDANGIEYFDREHPDDEARYIRIGLSSRRLLVVIFTERYNSIRIISA
jgi:uncharacterized protein